MESGLNVIIKSLKLYSLSPLKLFYRTFIVVLGTTRPTEAIGAPGIALLAITVVSVSPQPERNSHSYQKRQKIYTANVFSRSRHKLPDTYLASPKN